MNEVILFFKKDNAKDIINKSHEEQAWIKNSPEFEIINYNYAFDLKYPTIN